MPAAEVNSAHGGLLMVVTELVRSNASGEELQQILEDAPVDDSSRVAMATTAYNEYKPVIREILMNTGDFGTKKLVGFDWRLDYRVRSSGAGENTSVFLCRFRLMDEDGLETEEEMECDLSGMKNLLYKLNQATAACKLLEARPPKGSKK